MSERQKSATDAAPDLTVRFGDHLFLSGDSNKINDQHTGAVTMPEYRKQAWRRILQTRASAMEELGIPYRFLLAPDKQTVYRHLTPPEFTVRTAAHLRDLPFVIDPAPLLRAFAPMVDLYPRTDSHWNHMGAFLAAQSVLISLGLPTLDASLAWRDWTTEGDLGRKMIPPEPSTRPIVQYDAASTLIYDNGIGNNGRVKVFAKPETPGREPVIGLIYGDSFSYELVEFLREAFDVCIQVHSFSFDVDFVKAVQAAYVVSELTERFAFRLPSPLDGRSLHLIWAEKLLRGERPATLRVNHAGMKLPPVAVKTLERLEAYGNPLYSLIEQRRIENGDLRFDQISEIDRVVLDLLNCDAVEDDTETAERLATLCAVASAKLGIAPPMLPFLTLLGTTTSDASLIRMKLFEPGGSCLREDVVVPIGLRRLVVRRFMRSMDLPAATRCLARWTARRGQRPTPRLDVIALELLRLHRQRPDRRIRKMLLDRLVAHPFCESGAYMAAAEALLSDGNRAGAASLLNLYVQDVDYDAGRYANRDRLLVPGEL